VANPDVTGIIDVVVVSEDVLESDETIVEMLEDEVPDR
jgi:hypothetical protein